MHFLTFGAADTWPGAAKRLAQQAQATGLFSTVTAETGDQIFSNWPEFAAHRPFIEANPRGWGYWLWKPFLIASHMRRIDYGDVLFYLDSGFEIISPLQLKRMFERTSRRGSFILAYAKYPSLNAIHWCKQDLLDKMQRDFSIRDVSTIPAHAAGCVALVKNQKNLSLVDDWYRIASSDIHLIDDSPSIAPQQALYFEHRHDQAVFNLLVAAYNIPIAGDFFDFDVLRGAEGTLERLNPWVVVELNHALAKRNQSVNEALKWLVGRGYQKAFVTDYENFVLRRDNATTATPQTPAIELSFDVRPIFLPSRLAKDSPLANMSVANHLRNIPWQRWISRLVPSKSLSPWRLAGAAPTVPLELRDKAARAKPAAAAEASALLNSKRTRLLLTECDHIRRGEPFDDSLHAPEGAGIDVVSTAKLHTAFGFQRPFVPKIKVYRRPLAEFKTEIDEVAIFSYIYEQAKPKRHLEFGTWEGFGATVCARSSGAEIWTINLPHGETDAFGKSVYGSNDFDGTYAAMGLTRAARGATDSGDFIGWRYRAAGYGDRVHQILCDSRDFDASAFGPGFFDTVLIDGGHAADVVLNDTDKALPLLRSGGIMIWHDFCPEPQTVKQCEAPRGVIRAVIDNFDRWQQSFSKIFWIQPSWILIGIKM